jgi:hypothetical protein
MQVADCSKSKTATVISVVDRNIANVGDSTAVR